MKKFVIFTLLFSLFSSCAAYQSGNLAITSAGTKYIYEDIAVGTAKAERIFGLGGIQKNTLIAEAKRNLMVSRPLKESEEYINFAIDFKRSFFLFVDQTKVTLTADIIRYTATEPKERYSALYLSKQFPTVLADDLFQVGDSVMINHYVLNEKQLVAKILTIGSDEKATVLLKKRNGERISKQIRLKHLYKLAGEYNGQRTGANYQSSDGVGNAEFTIVGLGKKQMLLQKPNGSYKTMNYPK